METAHLLIEARTIPSGSELRTDVCIVGAGPSSLTLAHQLMTLDRSVLVIEQGETHLPTLEFESPHFESPLPMLPHRVGGMSAAWGVPLDAHSLGARFVRLDSDDLAARDWVPHSGWPFALDEIEPYYKLAEQLCCGPIVQPGRWEHDALALGDDVTTSLDSFGPREVFTENIRGELEQSATSQLLIGARASEIDVSPDNSEVQGVHASTSTQHSLTVRARDYVLAAGAIENARLLLLPGPTRPTGVGNANTGRFFMDHHYVVAGEFAAADPSLFERLRLYDLHRRDGALTMGKLRLTAQSQREHELLNANARFEPIPTAAITRARAATRRLTRERPPWREKLSLLATAAAQTLPLATTEVELGLAQRRWRRQGVNGWTRLHPWPRRFDALRMILQTEQAPDPENRVTLGSDRDPLGQPVAHLSTRWTEPDLHSIRENAHLLAKSLEQAGFGPMTPQPGQLPSLYDPRGAQHHMGTTRMHSDPTLGVVDQHARVHGAPNLHVAGASVFPTGSYVNPTLTSVALAMRLADRLARPVD